MFIDFLLSIDIFYHLGDNKDNNLVLKLHYFSVEFNKKDKHKCYYGGFTNILIYIICYDILVTNCFI